MPPSAADAVVRRARPDELEAIVELAASSLGWERDRPNAELFAWKHLENPFGASPMWVAESAGRLIGFRAFLRWRFRTTSGLLAAVRAVDTATHPDHQRKGIFTALTTVALGELEDEGTDLVFNTPNDQSLPGYLRMGWERIGQLSVAVRPAGLRAAIGLVRVRQPAEKWSTPVRVGVPATEALADHAVVERLGPAANRSPVTDRSPEYLRWRYGFEPLHYRVLQDDTGVVVFRVRRRGPLREGALCEWAGSGERPPAGLLRRLTASGEVDYVLTLGRPGLRERLIPAIGQGPLLTARTLGRPASTMATWHPALGDIELF